MIEQENMAMQSQPEVKSHKALLILILIIFLLFIGFIFWFFMSKTKTPQSAVTTQLPPPTFAQDRATIDANTKIPAPVVSNSTSVKQTELPTDLANFIPSGVTGTVVNKATFADGTTGYTITYADANSPVKLISQFTQASLSANVSAQQRYTILSSIATNLAGTLEEQNATYRVRIDANSDGTGGSKITISIIVRK